MLILCSIRELVLYLFLFFYFEKTDIDFYRDDHDAGNEHEQPSAYLGLATPERESFEGRCVLVLFCSQREHC